MISMDCADCPARPEGCEGCIISLLIGEKSQVDDLSEESCGYVLEPEIRSAIEVLRELGMVTTLQILTEFEAA